MDFLAGLIERGKSVEEIGAIAAVFRQVGRDQVKELPQIINGLGVVSEGIANTKELYANDSAFLLKYILVESVGKQFGINTLEQKSWPEWFREIVASYGHL